MVLALGGAPEYIAAVTSGFLIGGPFFAIGLYEISRRHEKQQPCSLMPTLMAWKGNAGNLGIFTAVLLVIFLVWARASMVAFALFYSGEMPTMSGFLRHVISTDHIGFLLAYFAILSPSASYIGLAILLIAYGALGLFEVLFDRGAKSFNWMSLIINVLLIALGVLAFVFRARELNLLTYAGGILLLIGAVIFIYGYFVQKRNKSAATDGV